MEADSCFIADEDMAEIIQPGEKIGTIMMLQTGEVWQAIDGSWHLF
jgi:hypothetical protein